MSELHTAAHDHRQLIAQRDPRVTASNDVELRMLAFTARIEALYLEFLAAKF